MTENKIKNERFISKIGLPYYIISYADTDKPIASVFSDGGVKYTDFSGIVIPEVAALIQKDIVYVLCERILSDGYADDKLPFKNLYKTKIEWLRDVSEALADMVTEEINFFDPTSSCVEIKMLCHFYLCETKYYIHTDNKGEGSLCISIWGDSGKRVPVAKIALDGAVQYLALDEIKDELLLKELGDLVFAYLCNIATLDLSLDFEQEWLNSTGSCEDDSTLVEPFGGDIEKEKAIWVESVIDDFMFKVISKVFPQYKSLKDVPDDILNGYYDDCVSYLFRELEVNS